MVEKEALVLVEKVETTPVGDGFNHIQAEGVFVAPPDTEVTADALMAGALAASRESVSDSCSNRYVGIGPDAYARIFGPKTPSLQ